jgi:hypothetical protein
MKGARAGVGVVLCRHLLAMCLNVCCWLLLQLPTSQKYNNVRTAHLDAKPVRKLSQSGERTAWQAVEMLRKEFQAQQLEQLGMQQLPCVQTALCAFACPPILSFCQVLFHVPIVPLHGAHLHKHDLRSWYGAPQQPVPA